MKHILFVLTLSSSLSVLGQDRALHIKTYEDGDSSLWYKWRKELSAQIELDTIQNTKNNWHFRLWTNKQAIDIWQDSNGDKFGKLTSWTKEFTPGKEEPTNRIFYKIKLLDSIKTIELIHLIDSTKIKEIPDEDSIQSWRQGFDGITYIVETANTKNYFFKTYWTPRAQDSLKEAIAVQSFVDRSLGVTDSNQIWSDFASRIPYECYINGGPRVACKILTKRERRKYKKERENYRQSSRRP
ncbi:MAG: hypothetical protein Roseis2KO_46740 [Roseivirga sp.]